jgi:DNA-binding CsgD family transcriptional regulator
MPIDILRSDVGQFTRETIAIGETEPPPSIGAAAEAVVRARGEALKLKRVFDRSYVPMVMLNDRRQHVDANRPARLAFRLSLAELRRLTPDEVVPVDELPSLESLWTRLLETGRVAGQSVFGGPDGGRVEFLYWGLANALPGVHLFACAPAGWPEGELALIEDESADRAVASLTPRQREVLQLAADGFPALSIAERLSLSPSTVKTHFEHIYEKLEIGNRTAAVAKGMRLGLID